MDDPGLWDMRLDIVQLVLIIMDLFFPLWSKLNSLPKIKYFLMHFAVFWMVIVSRFAATT